MQKIVIGNLKMNLEEKDVDEYLNIIKNTDFPNVDLYMSPSYIYLSRFKSKNYHLTAQNVSLFNDGAYTGEISALQLKSIGVDSVIIGHSERRIKFNEDSKIINKKIKIALENNLKVILCIGESKKVAKENTINILIEELKKDLKDISDYSNIIIAYEPVYAIGSNTDVNVFEIKEIIDSLKSFMEKLYKTNIKIVYGGSINENNINEIINICDGVIVGKTSINAKKIIEMLKKI